MADAVGKKTSQEDQFLFNSFIRTNFCIGTEQTNALICSLLFLSPEEAGLLLGDTVFPLGQRELGTVPPSQKHTYTQLECSLN